LNLQHRVWRRVYVVPGRKGLPSPKATGRTGTPPFFCYSIISADKRNKVKQNLTLAALLRPRRRLAGAGTRGPGPSGFRIVGRLWLEEEGETKRLGIARALVIEPKAFCPDAPATNLDKIL